MSLSAAEIIKQTKRLSKDIKRRFSFLIGVSEHLAIYSPRSFRRGCVCSHRNWPMKKKSDDGEQHLLLFLFSFVLLQRARQLTVEIFRTFIIDTAVTVSHLSVPSPSPTFLSLSRLLLIIVTFLFVVVIVVVVIERVRLTSISLTG
jgi:hypothetical protein